MPITTIDEWNHASFEDAFNQCFSRINPWIRDIVIAAMNKLPRGTHKACVCFIDNVWNSLHFIPLVFISRNHVVNQMVSNYIVGINTFNATAIDEHSNYSQQCSHSERAIGCFFHMNKTIRYNDFPIRIIDATDIILIKNEKKACCYCDNFLEGVATFYYNHYGQIVFFLEKAHRLHENIVPRYSHELLKHQLLSITTTNNNGNHGEHICQHFNYLV